MRVSGSSSKLGGFASWLRERIRRQLGAIYESSVETQTPPNEEALQQLQGLVNLLDIFDAFVQRPRRLFGVAIVFAVTAIGVAALLYAGPGTTRIEFSGRASDLTFTTTDRPQVLGTFSARSLFVKHAACAQVPPQTSFECAPPEADYALSLRSKSSDRSAGVRAVLLIAPDSRISLSASLIDQAFSVTLPAETQDYVVQVSSAGPIAAEWRGRSASLPATSPPIELKSIPGHPITLKFDGIDAGSTVLDPMIQIVGIDFETRESLQSSLTNLGSGVRSSVEAGTIFLKDLNDQQVEVRPFDWVQLGTMVGEIRTLAIILPRAEAATNDEPATGPPGEMNPAHTIGIDLSGTTTRLMIDKQRNYMPSWLQYISSRQPWLLYVSAVTYIFGLAVGSLRLFRYVD